MYICLMYGLEGLVLYISLAYLGAIIETKLFTITEYFFLNCMNHNN